ncbi:MAG TPA: hypothetical protein PKB15_02765 [Acidimicrobiia bacterium]|nr:hypothetical protein [Acidimicrobiia bacterium]
MYLEGTARNNPHKWALTIVAVFMWPLAGLVSWVAFLILDELTKSTTSNYNGSYTYTEHSGWAGWLTFLIFWTIIFWFLFLLYRGSRIKKPGVQVVKTIAFIILGIIVEFFLTLPALFVVSSLFSGNDSGLFVKVLLYILVTLAIATGFTFFSRFLFTQRQIRAARIAQEEPRA